ncbi:hypothetical protein LTS18_001923 [Coniosporium uncinatum]|uniref:Uncharacterized protein n=1 Tax=Coniosporium uncinatum TaxID=93489 RepID=A0ACC3DV17_9PEZI|nr:hypothetical protein LTS18_001923 [Coniosporium uncinatum]
MKRTLEQYIDTANIPKKYGGTLDFEFGMMPILEPSFEDALHWKQGGAVNQKGAKTFPTGPIKWHEHSDGTLDAVAVGSEHGRKRDHIIASVKGDVHGMSGISRSHTNINAGSKTVPPMPAMTGHSTHPNESQTVTPRSESPEHDIPGSTSPDAGRTSTSSARNFHPTPSDFSGTRAGTSDTRFDQLYATHAQGQLAYGTPAVNDHGYGDKTATMEPSTVGQAPKDVSIPPLQYHSSGPTYIEQAQALPGQAYDVASRAATSAMAAVGLGGQEQEQPRKEHKLHKKEDPRVDGLSDRTVEEFMRARMNTGNLGKAVE